MAVLLLPSPDHHIRLVERFGRLKAPTINHERRLEVNDCFGYLPSAQVAKEGGHEDIGITLWIWGESLAPNAGFFTEDVQDVVVNTVSKLAKQAGRPPSQK